MPHLARKISDFAFSTSLYRWSLAGPLPEGLNILPIDPWPGDAGQGSKILHGQLNFANLSFDMKTLDWQKIEAPQWVQNQLHSFSWLKHLHALGGTPARSLARQLITSWIDENRAWDCQSWSPSVIAERVTSWLNHYGFFGASADEDFHRKALDSLARQLRHLVRVKNRESGVARIHAAKALVYGAVCLVGDEFRLDHILDDLADELPHLIFSDGIVKERSPAAQVNALRDLLEIRSILTQREMALPDFLQQAISQLTPMVKFFRHSDGKLALFNGADEGDRVFLDQMMGQANGRPKTFHSAPVAGFERLAMGKTVVITDVGMPMAGTNMTHAGTLSFEMSVGKDRLITNCGTYTGEDARWGQAMRATAAHSTVVLGSRNLMGFTEQGLPKRLPKSVKAHRSEADGNIFIEANHDGYESTLHASVTRRLYLSEEGLDLRGEDILTAAPNGAGSEFASRFHLHPLVQASFIQNHTMILLRLPSGRGWRFRASGAKMTLEDSIYLPQPGEMKRSQQIVLSGALTEGSQTVKWSFQEEGLKQKRDLDQDILAPVDAEA